MPAGNSVFRTEMSQVPGAWRELCAGTVMQLQYLYAYFYSLLADADIRKSLKAPQARLSIGQLRRPAGQKRRNTLPQTD